MKKFFYIIFAFLTVKAEVFDNESLTEQIKAQLTIHKDDPVYQSILFKQLGVLSKPSLELAVHDRHSVTTLITPKQENPRFRLYLAVAVTSRECQQFMRTHFGSLLDMAKKHGGEIYLWHCVPNTFEANALEMLEKGTDPYCDPTLNDNILMKTFFTNWLHEDGQERSLDQLNNLIVRHLPTRNLEEGFQFFVRQINNASLVSSAFGRENFPLDPRPLSHRGMIRTSHEAFLKMIPNGVLPWVFGLEFSGKVPSAFDMSGHDPDLIKKMCKRLSINPKELDTPQSFSWPDPKQTPLVPLPASSFLGDKAEEKIQKLIEAFGNLIAFLEKDNAMTETMLTSSTLDYLNPCNVDEFYPWYYERRERASTFSTIKELFKEDKAMVRSLDLIQSTYGKAPNCNGYPLAMRHNMNHFIRSQRNLLSARKDFVLFVKSIVEWLHNPKVDFPAFPAQKFKEEASLIEGDPEHKAYELFMKFKRQNNQWNVIKDAFIPEAQYMSLGIKSQRYSVEEAKEHSKILELKEKIVQSEKDKIAFDWIKTLDDPCWRLKHIFGNPQAEKTLYVFLPLTYGFLANLSIGSEHFLTLNSRVLKNVSVIVIAVPSDTVSDLLIKEMLEQEKFAHESSKKNNPFFAKSLTQKTIWSQNLLPEEMIERFIDWLKNEECVSYVLRGRAAAGSPERIDFSMLQNTAQDGIHDRVMDRKQTPLAVFVSKEKGKIIRAEVVDLQNKGRKISQNVLDIKVMAPNWWFPSQQS